MTVVRVSFLVEPRAAAALKVYVGFAQVLLPQTAEMTEVHLLLTHLARLIEQGGGVRTAVFCAGEPDEQSQCTVLPFRPRDTEPPSAA